MTQHKFPWRSSAVIVENNKVLLIHRFKNNREYFVLPGGSMEEGESEKETLLRELQEEANVEVKVTKKLAEVYNDFDGRTHRIFLCQIAGGTVQLDGPEAERNSKENRYLLEWHPLSRLSEIPLYPAEAKELIISSQN